MAYNWQLKDWPQFHYDQSVVEDLLLQFLQDSAHLSGLLKGLPEETKTDVVIATMVSEALKTSAIEGEYLSRKDVVSSIKKNLGFQTSSQVIDKRVKGVASLMTEIHRTYKDQISELSLLSWHKTLMQGSKGINIGQWRKHSEPMQVISGSIGKEKIHFEAPPSFSVPKEMDAFIQWFNGTSPNSVADCKLSPIRSAIAHLYFESIHPFEDGNGRIGRVISEKALSQGLGHPVLISLSKTIEANKTAYYEALMQAQRTNEATEWIKYFVQIILDAQKEATKEILFVLRKTKFYDQLKGSLNSRQEKVIRKMFEAGEQGFEGGMNAKKYMAINKTSKATATRDLQDLTELKVLTPTGGGRSTRYELNIPEI